MHCDFPHFHLENPRELELNDDSAIHKISVEGKYVPLVGRNIVVWTSADGDRLKLMLMAVGKARLRRRRQRIYIRLDSRKTLKL
jgi:hypothetical protein